MAAISPPRIRGIRKLRAEDFLITSDLLAHESKIGADSDDPEALFHPFSGVIGTNGIYTGGYPVYLGSG
jgi:hypothetical protein